MDGMLWGRGWVWYARMKQILGSVVGTRVRWIERIQQKVCTRVDGSNPKPGWVVVWIGMARYGIIWYGTIWTGMDWIMARLWMQVGRESYDE